MGKKILNVLWDYIVLLAGTFIYCISWTSFLIPNGIASGGLTGAAAIVEFATGIPVSYTFISINILLLLAGFFIMGKGFGFKTVFCIVISTVLLRWLPSVECLQSIPGQPLYISEKVLVPIIGGLVEAVGIGFIFLKGGSTGGTDIVALMINKFWPVTPGRVFMIIDLFIIASVLLVPGKTFQDMIYGYIAMVTFSVAIDYFLVGNKSTLQVLIFSDKYEQIAEYVNKEMDRGVTALNAMGWYTKSDKKVLLVLLRKAQLPELTKAIKAMDKKAFVSISSARSVYGEGFEEIKTGLRNKKDRKYGSLNQ